MGGPWFFTDEETFDRIHIISYNKPYHPKTEEEFDEAKTIARLGCDTAFDRG
jgi:hypothetical protein